MGIEDLRIGPAEAKARVDAGKAIILDTVAPQKWELMPRSVAGSIRINPQELEQRYNELSRDKQIIAYCT